MPDSIKITRSLECGSGFVAATNSLYPVYPPKLLFEFTSPQRANPLSPCVSVRLRNVAELGSFRCSVTNCFSCSLFSSICCFSLALFSSSICSGDFPHALINILENIKSIRLMAVGVLFMCVSLPEFGLLVFDVS